MKRLAKLYAVFAITLLATFGAQAAVALLVASETTAVSVGVASADSPTASSFVATKIGSSTQGTALGVRSLTGFRVSICAASGQTLSGAGALRAYLLDEGGNVNRNPGLDLPITVTATSCRAAAAQVPCRCQVFPDQVTGIPAGGYVMYRPEGVTVSGGATVTTAIVGTIDGRLQ